MVKYEINSLHKCAQMGKECCEHLLVYCKDPEVKDSVKEQLSRYKEQMHALEKVYFSIENINKVHSFYYSTMLKINLFFKNDTQDIIKDLLKGNIMGLTTVTKFIQCPYNSDKSKTYATRLLEAINQNIEDIMEDYFYFPKEA